ncbi:alpha-amylase family glycosyl hydrolase [Parabacteroides sp. PF5-6]|uniref:alpha-amylase family glycosyl hydrolase n=1 Tax=Parabacteroides sp. PF5-6 TaxID=1742403 RepID=UPI0024061BE0|nr:alpha-amylase family glycosyl hydrolase [Parabacteroides sp. PF5-6]MDF9831754.1 1,4-alpha-glucan branching enzyme [Parabacteroides sp. PF5-6]
MKRHLLFFLLLPFFLSLFSFSLQAQVTASPAEFTDTDAIEIIFNAAEGTKGLQGYTGEVYAHTGVITDKSSSTQDWMYAPTWGDNAAKYKLTSLGNDQWKLAITPDVRSYYGVPAGEKILKLAFVFRSADKSKEGKATGGGDIFLNLGEAAFTPTTPTTQKRPDGVTDGINYINDQTVTLLLYAPGKEHVHLLGDFNNWKKDNAYQLYKDGDYWWYTLTGLEKGKEYGFQYLIDNAFKIGDAYCEKILDPSHDSHIAATTYPNLNPYPVETDGIVSILQTGKKPYDWKVKDFKTPAREELVIYELLVRDFTTAGTIQAVHDKLDYIESLGVNAIELMPIQEFDGNDSWGYNPCFFFAPDKAYGTAEAYKAFIDAAHQRGMAVILDVVFNHATGQHPFARLYWDGDRPAADNPWFNQEAPHPYSVFNDFNHEYTGTRDYFKRVLAYWLEEYKVDGFRFDLTKGFTQNRSTEATAGTYDASRVAILKNYNDQVRGIKEDAIVIFEHFCDNREELELAQDGVLLWNNLNKAYAESDMGWKGSESALNRGCHTDRGWTIPALITYGESHDEERLMYKMQEYGNYNMDTDKALRMQRAALGAAFLMATPGPKMVWQFGELGYDISIDQNERTGKKPVLWEYYEEAERKALYDTYATLIDFRRQYPELFASPTAIEMQTSGTDWANGRAIRLQGDEKDLVVLGNFTENPIEMYAGFTTIGTWEELFTGAITTVTEDTRNQKISLPAHSFKFYSTTSKETANETICPASPVKISYDPLSQAITIESDSPIIQAWLYSVSGALISQWQASSTLQVQGLSEGLYIIQVYVEGKAYTEKILF